MTIEPSRSPEAALDSNFSQITSAPPATASQIDTQPSSFAEASTPRPFSSVQDVFEERRQRLERDKKEKEAKIKADREAMADARRDADKTDHGSAK